MTGVIEKVALRKSLEANVPERLRDVVFGSDISTTSFDNLWHAILFHFGEIEMVARREYERGYEDGKSGKPWRGYHEP